MRIYYELRLIPNIDWIDILFNLIFYSSRKIIALKSVNYLVSTAAAGLSNRG